VVVLSVEAPDLSAGETLGVRLVAEHAPVLLAGTAADDLAGVLGCELLPGDPVSAVGHVAAILRPGSSGRDDDASPV